MTTTAATSAVLADQLEAALALPASPQTDAAIETATVKLIAALLRERVPAARYLHIDWSDQGPHHALSCATDADGDTVFTEDDDEWDVSLLVTNLRGAISNQFEAIFADGGIYRIDLNNF